MGKPGARGWWAAAVVAMFIALSGVALTVVGNWATAHQPPWLERLLAAHQVLVWIGLGALAAVSGALSVVAVRVGLSAAAPDDQAVAVVATMGDQDLDGELASSRLIGELQDSDAFDFEVHRATDTGEHGLSVLPPYLERQHDAALRTELLHARSTSRMILLLGGSSTGKTRACWEAVRDVLPDWTIWHPLAPDRPSALVKAIVANTPGPRTVIWLNEAQMYLGPDGTGEQAAASLQELLRRDASAPVVVLGSLWPEHLAKLTQANFGEHPAAAALLRQAVVLPVPSEFSDRDLEEKADQIATDPRLQWAADGSKRIAQRLAGAPELVRRYAQAGPHARAVVQAAMDARRLSGWVYLPDDFLLRAGPGYIEREEWEQTPEGDEWFERAIAYLSAPCHGTRGVLSRGRSTPGEPAEQGGAYQLADYLDELGHTERAPYSPPGTFWSSAVETCSDPGILVELAGAALARGRLKRADELAHRAADLGHPHVLRILARHQAELGDQSSADQLYREAVDQGDVAALWLMARRRERSGDQAGADRLYREAADSGDPNALRHLAWRREDVGDTAGADALMQEAAERGDTRAPRILAASRENWLEYRAWRESADHDPWAGPAPEFTLDRELAVPATAATANSALPTDTASFRAIALQRETSGDRTGAEEIALQAARHGYLEVLRTLANRREDAGDRVGAERMAHFAADHGLTGTLRELGRRRRRAGDHLDADRLDREAADRGDTTVLWSMAKEREDAGDRSGAEKFYQVAADRGDTAALRVLASYREAAGDEAGVQALYRGALDKGHRGALQALVDHHQHSGDLATAEQLRRFGVTDDGTVAQINWRPTIRGTSPEA